MGRGDRGARSRLRRVRRLGALGILWAIAQACTVDSGPSRCLNPQPLPPYCGNGSAPGFHGMEDGGPTASVGEADAASSEDASTGGGPSGEGGLTITPGEGGAAGDAGGLPLARDAGSDGGSTASHVEDAGLDGAAGDAAADADAQGVTDAPAPDAGHD